MSIYIDEAQHFLHVGDLGEALEQSRSLGAAWHLAHQHRSQMPDKLLRTIDSNARSKIIFGLEDDDARAAARTTGLDPEDFTRLPPYEIYTSLQSHGARTGWFSGRVLPPPKAVSSIDAVTAEAEARYGTRHPEKHPDTPTNATTQTASPADGDGSPTPHGKGDVRGDEQGDEAGDEWGDMRGDEKGDGGGDSGDVGHDDEPIGRRKRGPQ